MKIENNKLVFDKKELKIKKKIPARIFAGLNNFDKFNSPEMYLLMHHGLIPDEKIDPKYKLRGDFAENLVRKVYVRDGFNIIYHVPEDCNYDCFPHIKDWGGVPDIELPFDDTLIEVKSKSMSNYDYVSKYPSPSEYYQGLYYAYHRNFSSCIMEWIFFDPDTEDEIYNYKKPTTLKNLKRISKRYDVDRPEMSILLSNAKTKVERFRDNPEIPVDSIKPDVLQRIIKKYKEGHQSE